MKITKVFALLLIATSAHAQDGTPQTADAASQGDVFRNPCDRGPFPKLGSINSYRADFVSFLMERFSGMSQAEASYISYQLCDDLNLLGNSEALSQRLQLLIARSGY